MIRCPIECGVPITRVKRGMAGHCVVIVRTHGSVVYVKPKCLQQPRGHILVILVTAYPLLQLQRPFIFFWCDVQSLDDLLKRTREENKRLECFRLCKIAIYAVTPHTAPQKFEPAGSHCSGDRLSRHPLRTGYRFKSTLFLITACSDFRAEYSRDKRCCRLRSSLSEAISLQS